MLALTILTFLVQQCVTNIYIRCWSALGAIYCPVDVVVLVSYFYPADTPHATVLYTVLYVIKMAMQYLTRMRRRMKSSLTEWHQCDALFMYSNDSVSAVPDGDFATNCCDRSF